MRILVKCTKNVESISHSRLGSTNLRVKQGHNLRANLRVVLPTGPRNERREDTDGLINSLDDKARLSRRVKCWVKSG